MIRDVTWLHNTNKEQLFCSKRLLWTVLKTLKVFMTLQTSSHIFWSSQQPCEVGIDMIISRAQNRKSEIYPGIQLVICYYLSAVDLRVCVKAQSTKSCKICSVYSQRGNNMGYCIFIITAFYFHSLVLNFLLYYNLYKTSPFLLQYLFSSIYT